MLQSSHNLSNYNKIGHDRDQKQFQQNLQLKLNKDKLNGS